jgi:hypothetical protein
MLERAFVKPRYTYIVGRKRILMLAQICAVRDGDMRKAVKIGIRIRIVSGIRAGAGSARINLQLKSQNVSNMSLFEHFF